MWEIVSQSDIASGNQLNTVTKILEARKNLCLDLCSIQGDPLLASIYLWPVKAIKFDLITSSNSGSEYVAIATIQKRIANESALSLDNAWLGRIVA